MKRWDFKPPHTSLHSLCVSRIHLSPEFVKEYLSIMASIEEKRRGIAAVAEVERMLGER